jgi:hypothetical protein
MIKINDGVLYLPQHSGIVITTTVNNVNPGTGPVLYARQLVIGASITGFSGGEENRLLIVQPTRNSSEEVNLDHNSGSSSAGNKLMNRQAVTQVTAFWGGCMMYIYDNVENVWKHVG